MVPACPERSRRVQYSSLLRDFCYTICVDNLAENPTFRGKSKESLRRGELVRAKGKERIYNPIKLWSHLSKGDIARLTLMFVMSGLAINSLLTPYASDKPQAHSSAVVLNLAEAYAQSIFILPVIESTQGSQDRVNYYKDWYLKQSETGFSVLAENIKDEYQPLILQAASTVEKNMGKKINPLIIDSIPGLIMVESSANPLAISVDEDRGLCQLTPDAEKDAKKALDWGNVDIHDPGINLTLAIAYLTLQMDRFQDPVLAISSYNAGPKTVLDFVRKGGADVFQNPGIEYYFGVRGATEAIRQIPMNQPQTKV